jgi:hypothetical protein
LIEGGVRKGDKSPRHFRQPRRDHRLWALPSILQRLRLARWDAFADVDDFVNEVQTELAAMARDGTRPQRSGANREHAKSWGVSGGLRQNLIIVGGPEARIAMAEGVLELRPDPRSAQVSHTGGRVRRDALRKSYRLIGKIQKGWLPSRNCKWNAVLT